MFGQHAHSCARRPGSRFLVPENFPKAAAHRSPDTPSAVNKNWNQSSRCKLALEADKSFASMGLRISSISEVPSNHEDSNFNTVSGQQVSFYHTKFSDKATKCWQPCSFKSTSRSSTTSRTIINQGTFRTKQSLGRHALHHRAPSSCPGRNFGSILPCQHWSGSEHCAAHRLRPKQTFKIVTRGSKWFQVKVVWHPRNDYQNQRHQIPLAFPDSRSCQRSPRQRASFSANEFTRLLRDQPELTTPTFSLDNAPKLGVKHYIDTNGPPVHAQAWRLSPEKLVLPRTNLRHFKTLVSSDAQTARFCHVFKSLPSPRVAGILLETSGGSKALQKTTGTQSQGSTTLLPTLPAGVSLAKSI